MVAVDYFVVMGDSRHRAAITTVAVPVIRPGVCVVGVLVWYFPSNTDGYVPSSENIGMGGLLSPPPVVAGSFPIIADV